MLNKVMLKKVILTICAVCLMALMLLPLSACGIITASGPGSAEAAKDSVVFIYAETSTSASRGSGFAIGELGAPVQYIVTNAHCVLDSHGNYASVTVYFSVAANNYMIAEILWVDAERDLAVLRLPEPTTERSAAVLCPEEKINLSGEFYALGYPAATDFADDFRAFDKSSIAITRGGIQRKTRVFNTDVYLLDLAIHGGNSGGPLVNSKGEIVGINTFGVTDPNSGVEALYAVTIDELIRNMRSGIPYTAVGDVNVSMVIVLAAIIVGVLIVTAIIFAIMGKKKSRLSPAAAGAYAPGVHAPPAYAPPVQAAAPHGNTVPVVKTYIIGISGAFAGRKFEVGNKIIIGRDSSKCAVAFSLDTAGISGIHCEVTFDGSTAYLRDLGSSYGTFIAHGNRKLEPKVPVRLSVGERFYVGSADNTFEFTM